MFKLGCSCHGTNEDYCGRGLCLPKSIQWLKPRQLPEGMLTARDRASEALKQAAWSRGMALCRPDSDKLPRAALGGSREG